MSWVAAAVGGGAVLGGVLGSNASKDASRAQADSANNAIQLQREQWASARNDNAPFLATGTAANKRLAMLLGVGGDSGAEGSGDLLRKFSATDLQADPVYQSGLQFGADQGRDAINARATAGGMYDSGATLKALTRFGNDYGSTKANESFNRFNTSNDSIFNRLAGVSGAGQVASNQVTTAGMNAANNIGNEMTGAGNARAAGIVGGANAWGGAVNNASGAYNNYSSNQRLMALLSNQGAGNGYFGGSGMYNQNAAIANSDRYGY